MQRINNLLFSKTEEEKIICATRHWVKEFVIDLNLCPFAGKTFLEDTIRFAIFFAEDEQILLENVCSEIEYMQTNREVATTLLLHPNVLQSFDDYNQFLTLMDNLLEQTGCIDEFQIASFHPEYQFAETKFSDAENFSNRSPFPMLHILRESMVSDAVDGHKNIHDIPITNIQRLREIGSEQLSSQLLALQNR